MEGLAAWNAKNVRPPCPHCGEKERIIVLVFGRPSDALQEFAADAGNLVRLCGCAPSPDDRRCAACDSFFVASP